MTPVDLSGDRPHTTVLSPRADGDETSEIPREGDRQRRGCRGELCVVRASVLASVPIAIVRSLDDAGVDGMTAALQAGISSCDLEDPSGRVAEVHVENLWELAVAATEDPAFALQVSRHFTPTSLHSLGVAMTSSRTLRDAAGRASEFYRVVSDLVRLRVESRGEHFLFVVEHLRTSRNRFEPVDNYAASAVRQARQLLADPGFCPASVRLRRPAPPDPKPFTQLFGCDVFFGSEMNYLEFRAADVDRALPSANARIATAADAMIRSYLSRVDDGNLSTRVRRAVLDSLSDATIDQTKVAGTLGLNPRALRRGLAAEGISFREVYERARKDAACEYLRNGELSVSEVGYRLGFSDAASFSRAFRRWAGTSPSDFSAGRRSDS